MPGKYKGFLSAFILLCCAVPALAAQPAGEDLRELRIARYDTGGVAHPVAAVLTRVLADMGMTLVWVDVPLARSLQEVERGVLLDADPGRVPEALAGYKNLVRVPVPAYHLRFSAFVRDDTVPVNGIASLRERTVVVNRGTVMLEKLIASNGLKNVYYTDTYTGALMMLILHRADVAILPHEEAMQAFGNLHISYIRPSGDVLSRVPIYLVLNKRHAALLPRLAAGISDYRKSHPE